MRVLRYILRRLLFIVPVLLGSIFIAFLLTRIVPGNPIERVAGPYASDEAVEELKREAGLLDPIPVQFYNYIKQLLRGDMGVSYQTNQPVTQDLRERLPASLELVVYAMTLAILLALPLSLVLALPLVAGEPCTSGVPVGKRPTPYSFLIATGPQRGQQTCYICEQHEGGKPAALVFAKSLSDPLAKLMSKLEAARPAKNDLGYKAWLTQTSATADLDGRTAHRCRSRSS